VSLRLADIALIVIASAIVATPVAAQSVSLRIGASNTYRTDVVLNHRLKKRALIDTGASSLSMCRSAARALGLSLGTNVELDTANGVIIAQRAMVRSVRIGSIEVRDVEAVVKDDATGSCDELLVGMSVLRKLHVTINAHTLTLVARGHVPVWLERSMLGGFWVLALYSLVGSSSRWRKRPLLVRRRMGAF
jgi:clan AA aspartic protease (TIGR02281 family)